MIMVIINNISLSKTMTLIGLCSLFIPCVTLGSNLVTLYQRTRNISSSNWDSATKTTQYGIRNVIDCAGKCQIRQGKSGDCNAFKFDNESDSCAMGVVTFLEDPGPGENPETIMMDTDIIPSLNQVCRGGESCCGPEATRTCGEGEGDCQGDGDCQGTLQCGKDNCAQSGGLWDAEDDCCERRCSSDRPCPQVKWANMKSTPSDYQNINTS